MIKFLLNLFRPKLKAVILRRYKLTSGNIGELYLDGTLLCDSHDTYEADTDVINAVCKYKDFVEHGPLHTIRINDMNLHGRRIQAEVYNKWVSEC